MKKLILIDSDGTLRHSDGSISSLAIKNIKRLKDMGCYVVICSGKPRYMLLDIVSCANASLVVVSSNGSEIFDIDNNIFELKEKWRKRTIRKIFKNLQ